jgi:hypothetical protein
MDKLVACLAQYQESILGQVVVVGCVHMMYVQVGNTLIPNAAVLAGHIPVCTDEPAEQLPCRSASECCPIFCGLYLHTIYICANYIYFSKRFFSILEKLKSSNR